MNHQSEKVENLFEAVNGGHLHWSDFRDNVLESFRISCTPSPKAEKLPTTFLARLQAAQKNLDQHDAQRQAWRLDTVEGRGVTSSAVFPPNLVPSKPEASKSLRLMIPQMSREGLPLRSPRNSGTHSTMYELPTAKPDCVFGFDMGSFTKIEQAQLQGPLQVTGVSIDFAMGEVLPAQSLCCPYLAFESFHIVSEQCIETARNSCAIAGAQCLRGQQQLFHKAFGLQTVSQPPITFTCAISNEHAILNLHYIGDDGDYSMAPLCKFDLQNDAHFNTFQAWIEAIDSWAIMYLLPRIQGAISQVVHSYPSPPPSPTPTNSSLLSIDTTSSNVFSIVKDLRRMYPSVPWRNEQSGETPINSSVAQCGTPLPTREIRGLALPTPTHSEATTPLEGPYRSRRNSFMSPTLSEVLSPIQTNLSHREPNRPQSSTRQRFIFSPGNSSFSLSDGSCTPISPCRPPSLSPCSPGPEMPMSSMNPMLVLQRRLDVACTEILELRSQVDDLQDQLNKRADKVEQMLQTISERQAKVETLTLRCGDDVVRRLHDAAEQELKTPTASETMHNLSNIPEYSVPPASMIELTPGYYKYDDEDDDSINWCWPTLDRSFVIWCLAKFLKDRYLQSSLLAGIAVISLCIGQMNISDLCANMIMTITMIELVSCKAMLKRFHTFCRSLYIAARDLTLDDNPCNEEEGGAEHEDELGYKMNPGNIDKDNQERENDNALLKKSSFDAIPVLLVEEHAEEDEEEDLASTECVPIVLY